MTDHAAPTRDPSLDIAAVVAADFPQKSIDRLAGNREPRFQTVIKQSVLDEIHAHGKSSPEAEICGVLVGNVFHDDNGPYLHIHASIRGDSAENRAAQVTFKAETWTHIQNIMESDHPDARIVGWYHTHPGFGIFLSGMDLFIQDNFFNLPWQVAFVYDPTSGEEGLFVWHAGNSEREPFLLQEDTLEENQAKAGYEWKAPNDLAPQPAPLPRAKDPYSSGSVILLALIAFIVSFVGAMLVMTKPWVPKPPAPSPPATQQL
ncbi:MAG TPA: Mov34/MPN/PAD-1 family protein [Tepidisphaeraceae bacterium]|nr:Mov34/MPN/PAD-1 family protein [Tepidisphaeraceae bacterium]